MHTLDCNELSEDNTTPAADIDLAQGNALDHNTNNAAVAYEGFDEELHALGKDGKPRYNKDGSYARKRGRKAGAQSSGSVETPSASVVSTEDAAIQSANLLFNLSVFVGGDEWSPTKDEAVCVKTGFKNYYDARGIVNIPPELGLVIALGMYALPRLNKPSTREKISSLWVWVKDKFAKKKPE